MKERIKVYVAFFCVFLIVLGSYGSIFGSFSQISKTKKEIVIVRGLGKKDLETLDRDEFELIKSYGGNTVLLRSSSRGLHSLNEKSFKINELPSRTEISINDYSFDITEGEPDIAPDLKKRDHEKGTEGLYIIHMLGPVHPDWRETLQKKGVEIIDYVPNYAYETKMTPEEAEKINQLSFVDWVGNYHPAYKFPKDIRSERTAIELIDESSAEGIKEKFPHLKVEKWNQKRSKLVLNGTSLQDIKQLARLDEVYSISERVKPKLHSEMESQIIGGGNLYINGENGTPTGESETPYRKYGDHGAYINQLGYTGKNVTIAIADTGIGNGTLGDAGHPDLTGRVVGGHAFGSSDNWSDEHGHGTHVSGSAAGDTYGGAGTKGRYPGFAPYYMAQGLAYDSQLFSAKIFDPGWTDPNRTKIFEIPKKRANAYIHSNSWGAFTRGDYIQLDSSYDRAVRDADTKKEGDQPMVITVSAGNFGRRGMRTINSPGNAKNVITVGATETYMPDGGHYGGSNTESPDHISDFSSRGWTNDSRIKPDVVAPGENVLSLETPTRTSGGMYDWKSGTSMSNPAVAGASAVVVEWYEKNYGERPSPAMVKSLLINTARPLDGYARHVKSIPNPAEGWGMVDISKLEYPEEDPIDFVLKDQNNELRTGETGQYEVTPEETDEPLKISLVWTDKEAQPNDRKTLKNDLNLEVVSSSGKIYRGNAFDKNRDGWSDRSFTFSDTPAMKEFDSNGDGWDDVNNVENVYIRPEELESGKYRIKVTGKNIPSDIDGDEIPEQDYALTVYNADKTGSNLASSDGEKEIKTDSTQSDPSNEGKSDQKTPLNEENLKEIEEIHINGNDELADKADEEDWKGKGSENDPFVIEEYEIDGSGNKTGISIKNVTDHFSIENCRIHNASRNTEIFETNSGIFLENTRNGVIKNNTLRLNSNGIALKNSEDIRITDNDLTNNHRGVLLSSSKEIEIRSNKIIKQNFPLYGEGVSIESSSQNEIRNNTVFNSEGGIMLESSNKTSISKNNISHNDEGLDLEKSENNTIKRNDLKRNDEGIYIYNSDNNSVLENMAMNNDFGIYLFYSHKNLLSDNKVSFNGFDGIRLSSSDENQLISNTAFNNSNSGISLSLSEKNVLEKNQMYKNSIYMGGNSVKDWTTHSIDETNTVNGKPVYYWKNRTGGKITGEAGQVILANTTNVTVKDLEMENGTIGVLVGFSNRTKITDNSISIQNTGIQIKHSSRNTLHGNVLTKNTAGLELVNSTENIVKENSVGKNRFPGLYLFRSDSNLIFGNRIFDNDWYGIYLTRSERNRIYHNEISSNEYQAFDNGLNRWDNGEEGNYWSDYEEKYDDAEKGASGIWKTPYQIEGGDNRDEFPLIDKERTEKFSVSILTPSNNETVFSAERKIIWSSKGGEGKIDFEISLDNGQWIDVGRSKEHRFSGLEDGEHKIEIRGKDEKENVSEDEVSFDIETDVVVELRSHEEGDVVRRPEVTFEWESHNEEKTEIKLERPNDPGEWIDVGKNTSRRFSELEDGEYTFHLRSEGENGSSDEVQIDLTVKIIDLEIKNPKEDSVLNESDPVIEWDSNNAERYRLKINNGRWIDIEDREKVKLKELDSREYKITIRAVDEKGYSKTESFSFTVDTENPSLKILRPKDDETVRGLFLKVEWEGNDNESGIAYYEIKIDDGGWKNVSVKNQHTIYYIEEGAHEVKVKAWDEAGNSGTDRVEFETKYEAVDLINPWLILIVIGLLSFLLIKRYDLKKETTDEDSKNVKSVRQKSNYKEIEDEYKL